MKKQQLINFKIHQSKDKELFDALLESYKDNIPEYFLNSHWEPPCFILNNFGLTILLEFERRSLKLDECVALRVEYDGNAIVFDCICLSGKKWSLYKSVKNE